MMKRLMITAVALVLSGGAHAACPTNTPVSAFGVNGSNGVIGSGGVNPFTASTQEAAEASLLGSAVGQIAAPDQNGDPTWNGVANFHGTADCSALRREMEEAASNTAALAAALSAPIWLGDSEQFAISGGVGFTDDAAAVGATGVVRLGKNLAGWAGGAVSTENSDVWAGKAGLRVGW